MQNRLRELRKRNGMTQVRLAEKAKVNRTIIARFETGKTQITTKNLAKLSDALDCSMEDILKGGQTDGTAS